MNFNRKNIFSSSSQNSLKAILVLFFIFNILPVETKANSLSSKEKEDVENKSSFISIINKKLQLRNAMDISIPTYSHASCSKKFCEGFTLPSIRSINLEELEKNKTNTNPEVTNESSTEQPQADSTQNKKADIKDFIKKTNKESDQKTLYKYDDVETALVTLQVNKNLVYDFEIIMWPDSKISIPVITLADILEIESTVNHVNNNITFTHPISKKQIIFNHKENNIICGSNVINIKKPKMVRIEEGFIVQDDIFAPIDFVNYFFDIESSFDKNNYVLSLTSKFALTADEQQAEVEEEKFTYEEPLTNVDSYEKEEKSFKVERIDYGLNGTVSKTANGQVANTTENSNLNLASSGKLLGGEYNIGAGSFYVNDALDIGNFTASLDYTGSNYNTTLGSTFTRLSDLAIPGTSLVGGKFGTLGALNRTLSVPRFIVGSALDGTTVELFINDILRDSQDVKNGRFEFESINYLINSSFVDIRVEQVNIDSSREIVYKRSFSRDNDLLAKAEKEFLMFSGLESSILTNRFNLIGNKQINNSDSVKLISGAKYGLGISKKTSAFLSFAQDFKVKNAESITSTMTDRPGVIRQNRSSSGFITSLSLKHKMKENIKLASELALSNASSLSVFEPDGTDLGGILSMDYENKKHQFGLFAKAFHYGSNFYTVTQGNSIDKRGGELNFSGKVSSTNISGNFINYISNLDNVFDGGLSNIRNMNINLSNQIYSGTNLRLSVRANNCKNDYYKEKETNLNFTLSQQLGENHRMMINHIKTFYNNSNYKTAEKTKDTNDRLNIALEVDAGKIGKVRISKEQAIEGPEHRFLSSGLKRRSELSRNKFNIKLDRSNLPIHGICLSPSIGYQSGSGNNLNMGLDLGYQIKNLGHLVLRYRYNAVRSLASLNENKTHTISVNLLNNIDFGRASSSHKKAGLQTSFNPENSIIKGVVFLDLNQNGKMDEGEQGVPDIEISFKNLFNISSNNNGEYVATGLAPRRYILGIDKNSLPFIYSPTGNNISVDVKREKVYKVNLGVINTPGSISGNITVKKEEELNSDIIVLLLDKNGKEVKYTTTDSTGSYYIGSIPPGDYTVVVDKNYLDYKGMQMSSEVGHKVNIPLRLDDFVDIENLDIKLIEKRGQVKTF